MHRISVCKKILALFYTEKDTESRPFYNNHNKKIARIAESHKFERFNSSPDMSLFGFVLILGINSGYMSTQDND
jgi:hypothetical protein